MFDCKGNEFKVGAKLGDKDQQMPLTECISIEDGKAVFKWTYGGDDTFAMDQDWLSSSNWLAISKPSYTLVGTR